MKIKQRVKSFFSRALCLGRRSNKEEIEVSGKKIIYYISLLKYASLRRQHRNAWSIRENRCHKNRPGKIRLTWRQNCPECLSVTLPKYLKDSDIWTSGAVSLIDRLKTSSFILFFTLAVPGSAMAHLKGNSPVIETKQVLTTRQPGLVRISRFSFVVWISELIVFARPKNFRRVAKSCWEEVVPSLKIHFSNI